MAAAVDVAVLAQDVENMKTVLNSKIGANDGIMISVADQLGSLTRKFDEFYAMLKENDNFIKKRLFQVARLLLMRTPPRLPILRRRSEPR